MCVFYITEQVRDGSLHHVRTCGQQSAVKGISKSTVKKRYGKLSVNFISNFKSDQTSKIFKQVLNSGLKELINK